MAQVEILGEREAGRGWAFEAHVLCTDGRLCRLTLTLSWADYNLWSRDGADPPAAVADAVLTFLASRLAPDELSGGIDAATARRRFDGADQEIERLIGRP